MVMNQKPFHGYPITLTLHEPPQPEEIDHLLADPSSSSSASPRKCAQAKKPGEWTDAELVKEARDIIVRELLDVFSRDLKSRIVAGQVWDHIRQHENRDRPPSVVKREERSSATPVPLTESSSNTEAAAAAAAATAEAAGGAQGIVVKLPSFAKRKDATRRHVDSYRPNYASRSSRPRSESVVTREREQERDDARSSVASGGLTPSHEPTPTTTTKVRKARVLEESEEEREQPVVPVNSARRRQQQQERGKKESSSEGEEKPPEPEQPKAPVAVTKAKRKKASSRKAREARLEAFLDDDEEADESATAAASAAATLPTPAPTDSSTLTSSKRDVSVVDSDREWDLPSSKEDRPRSPTPDPWETGIALDDEDLYYARLALERLRHGESLHPSPEEHPNNHGGVVHETGSARSEGYYKINQADKAAYLSNRNRSILEEDDALAAAGAPGQQKNAATTAVATSRLARVNTRRLVQGFEQHKKQIASDTDVLKFNQLRTRKKQLKFSRSSIHWYGLYSMEVRPLCSSFFLFFVSFCLCPRIAHPVWRDGHRIRRRAHSAASCGPAREAVRANGHRFQLPVSGRR
jgi:hypothetical protein